jgi:hypothetical protein
MIMKSKLRITLSAMIWVLILVAAYVVSTHAQTNRTANQGAAKKVRATQISSTAPGSGTTGQSLRLASEPAITTAIKEKEVNNEPKD